MKHFQKKWLDNNKSNGFILPLVVIVTLILGAGMMATTTQAWLGLTGAVRQSRARSAREVAEAGLSQLIEELNRNHAHLLVVDKDNWDNIGTNPRRGGLLWYA